MNRITKVKHPTIVYNQRVTDVHQRNL
ncbi:protein of unknown function [Burkholderia multivorans]